MQFSTRGRYALRLMIDLAMHSGGGAIPLKDIGERQNISVKYLEQIVPQLTRAELVKSVRGAGGGYRLARAASLCTAGDVLRATEGTLAPIACLATENFSCERETGCLTLGFWRGMQQAVEQYADSVTLEDLTKQATDSGDYCI